jgi:ABC-type multidrug transport system permease subunit
LFKTIALCFPTGWALAGLNQLISFGAGLQAALLPMAVLLAFGAVANVLAIRFFRP